MKRLFLAVLAIAAGLSAGCGKSQDLGDAQTRKIYVVAKKAPWNYVEGGAPTDFPPGLENPGDVEAMIPIYTGDPAPDRIGTTYNKYLFFLANEDFNIASDWEGDKRRDSELGILGPVIRAQEGDTIELHVKRDASVPDFDIEMPGVIEAEPPVSNGDVTVYRWRVTSTNLLDNEDGLDPERNPAKALLYRATSPELEDAGLVGPVVIYAKGLLSTGNRPTPRGVDKEHFVLFKMFNENNVPAGLLADNITEFTGVADEAGREALLANADFRRSNLRFTVNGRQFGSGPAIEINTKARHVWYVIGGKYTESIDDPIDLPNNPAGWSYDPTWSSDQLTYTLHPSGALSHVAPRTSVLGDHILYPDIADFRNRGMFALYEVKEN